MPKTQRRCTMHHHPALKPEDILTFIEMHGFHDDLKRLGLTDDDLLALQLGIMAMPDGGAVIPGCGGLRKVRFAPKRWKTGKSGAARFCYVYFSEWGAVLLVAAYSKDEQDDIHPADRKAYRREIRLCTDSARWHLQGYQ